MIYMSKIYSIEEIISYMENTTEESWCEKVVRTKDWKNCFFWHLFAMCKDEAEANRNWDLFEDGYATTYMIYPVNDWEDIRYQQPTPKQRLVQYLKDLRDGKVPRTWDDFQESFDKKEKDNIMNL